MRTSRIGPLVVLATAAVLFAGGAQALDKVNLKATGIAVEPNGDRLDVTIDYALQVAGFAELQSASIAVNQYRGGATVNSFWFAAIIFGAESDGTNCISGGGTCSGDCKVKQGTKTIDGSCIRDGLGKGGVTCICNAGATNSLSLGTSAQPGDVFELVLDPANTVAESNETDNSFSISIP